MNMTHRIGSVAAIIVLADILSNGNLRAEKPDLLINTLEMCVVFYVVMCLFPYLLNKLRDKKLVNTYLLASPVIIIWAAMYYVQQLKSEQNVEPGTESLEFKILLISVMIVYMTAIILIQRYLQKKKKKDKQSAEPM